MNQHIGLAISGGGHRATIWGLGALMYLVDAGKHREIAAISSVSGGSITNGVVAHEMDLPQTGAAAFEEKIRPLVRHVAHTGLFFWGPATNAYVISLFAVLAVGAVGLLVSAFLLCADALSWPARYVPGWLARAGGGRFDAPAVATLLVSLLVLAAAARLFSRRSNVVDRALARTHFNRGGRPTRLADVQRSIDHVMCATELQSGDHIYLDPRFLYSYRLGNGSPAAMHLSTAVQASACLPGAFSPRRLPTAPHGFQGAAEEGGGARQMVLTDGGVYDNMADQWLVGLADRVSRQTPPPAQATEVDEVIVINASAPVDWTPMKQARLVLAGELQTLSRVSSVMYQVTTERRRRALVRAWDEADREGRGQRGALVHISQSPYTVADYYDRSQEWPGRAQRAAAALSLLGGGEARAAWAKKASRSRGVKTVLRSLGRDDTLNLLEHSYVLAMCNLHVLLDYPLLPTPGADRFTRLLA